MKTCHKCEVPPPSPPVPGLEDGAGLDPRATVLQRAAWLPILVLLLAILGLWVADVRTPYEFPYLQLGLYFVSSTLVSIYVAYLIGASFVARASASLLLLGAGVLIWGAAASVAVVATLLQGGPRHIDLNSQVTIHNLCVLMAALCHSASAACSVRWDLKVRAPRLWLAVAYPAALGVVGAIAHAALSGQTPTFFVQGQGGTLIRTLVLGSAILMLVLSAILLRASSHPRRSAFTHWYALALLLLALGLFGVMINSVQSSLLGWSGRAAQMLGGFYMLAAGLAARRQFGGIPLLSPPVHAKRHPYAIALAAVLASTVIWLTLLPGLGTRFPYIIFYPAAAFAALYGGLFPGMFAVLTSALLTDYFWLAPARSSLFAGPENAVGFALFFVSAGLVCMMADHMRRAQQRALEAEREVAAHRDRLEDMVGARTAELEKNANILRGILEAVTESIWVWDIEGRVLLANQTGLRRYGKTSFDEVSGRHMRELAPPEIGEQRYRQQNTVVESKSPVRWEDDRGETRYWHMLYPVLDAEGEVLCTVSFSLDITREYRAEQALREALADAEEGRRKLEAMMEHIPLGITIADAPDVTIRAVSRHGRELIEKTSEELTGIPASDHPDRWQVYHADGVTPAQAEELPLTRAIVHGEAVKEEEWVIKRRDGLKIPLLCTAAPIRDGDGRITGGVIGWQDITERKRAEDALRESERSLALALDATGLGRFDYYPQTDVVIWDELTRHHFGLSPQAPVDYDAWCAAIHPEDRERVKAGMRAAMSPSTDGQYHAEYRTIGAEDGKLRWLQARGRVYFDQDGKANRLIGCTLDITERKLAEQRVEYLAHYDPLTDLPNRALMNLRLGDMLSRAERHGDHAAVLYLDLDNFKPVNDSFGHAVGDELLRAAAQRLAGGVRGTDTVARMGGDEFVVLLEGLRDPGEAGWIAQSVIANLARPFHLVGQQIYVSVSVGIACYPDDGKTADALLGHADAAMYQAKQEGRNCHRYFSACMNSDAREKLLLVSGLRQAVDKNELVLNYQPRVAALTGELVGVEALVRWHSPQHGLILPNRFIGIAEETGIIDPLGEWVLRTACSQMKCWRAGGTPLSFVSVNLSARQFSEPKLADRIESILAETGLDPGSLELEITETVVMINPERATATLNRLAELGIRLSLDDFGTGHSSLAYLQRFPVHHIKIDQSFVRELPSNQDSAAITKAIIAMAKSLEIAVTAEGVEMEQQRDFLRANGCDALQGFFFSKPLDAEALRHFCLQWREMPLPA